MSKQSNKPKVPPAPLPEGLFDAIGIDIGKDGLHLCLANHEGDEDPAAWPVVYLDYKERPLWWKDLTNWSYWNTIITAEPTGWHYLAPVANVIEQYTQAELWLVNHQITGNMRELRLSGHKTDELDARALALIAKEIRHNRPPRGCHRHNQALENHVLNLRLNVNHYTKLTAEGVRYQNRLRQLGHSMFPSLGSSQTWRKLLDRGIVTPAQIHALEQAEGEDGRIWRPIRQLKENLPVIGVPSIIEQTAMDNWIAWQNIEDRRIETERVIIDLINREPFDRITHRWMTIPLAQPVWIAALHVATHGQADQFDKDAFAGALGTYPQKKNSGATKHERSSKKGYRPVVQAIFLWTQQFCNPKIAPMPNPVNTYFAGGEKNGGRKFTAARAKLARILWAVARSEQGYVQP